MSVPDSPSDPLKKLLSDIGITILAFALSWLLIYDITQISYFAPLEKASDFETTDFYQIVDDRRSVRPYSDDIVVVGIDDLSRDEIADAIYMISLCSPAAVGIDILFGYQQPDDQKLVEAISALPNAVVPDTSSYIYSSCPGLHQGSIFLEAPSHRHTIRHCKKEDTFAGELVALYNPHLNVPENMLIEYSACEFDVIHASEIPDATDIIDGRIVLVGAVRDISDLHPTPVHDALPGIMIHAASIATMLNENRITTIPEWLDWTLAIILCFAFIATARSLKERDWADCLMRIVQIALLLLIIVIGCWCYSRYRLNINFTRPLIMLATAAVAVDLWEGGIALKKLPAKIKSWFGKKKTSENHQQETQ